MGQIVDYIEAQKTRINAAIEECLPQFFSSGRMHEEAARYTLYPKITGKPAGQDEQKNTLLYRWGEQRVRNELKRRKEACTRNVRKVKRETMLEHMIEYMLTIPS